MIRFSANLGFLWKELALPDAIRAAKTAGFHAVECHFPYETPTADVVDALKETGLVMLGINTRRGKSDSDNGLLALPDRVDEARAAIGEAIAYAHAIGCGSIHAMAGVASGGAEHTCFVENLRHACAKARSHEITILIEPLNRHDAPGYFLKDTAQAIAIIEEVGAANLKLMFDCYHVQRTEGDLTSRLTALLPHIGHIQFAGVPDRGAPDQGEVAYGHIFSHIEALGYQRPLGAEYRPGGPTDATLGWLKGW